MSSRIPHTFHYCWFGRGEMPKMMQQCILTWNIFHPDWEIKCWNEDNYDVNKCAYTKDAYEQKKWAFVCDYARFDILNQYGGVFLDTDVEFVRTLPDDVLENEAFTGFETIKNVNPGSIYASVAHHPILETILTKYSAKKFGEKIDGKRIENIVDIVTGVLKEKGLVQNNTFQVIEGVAVYPREVFCCFDHETQTFEISDEAISVHRFYGSWSTWYRKVYYWILRRFIKVLGKDKYLIVKRYINRKSVFQFIKFCLVGVSNTLLSYLIYVALIYFGMHYSWANFIGFTISVINSYYWNNKYVFKSSSDEKRTAWRTFIKTYLSYAVTGIGLNTLLLFLWISIINISEIIAPVFNLFITIPINFLLNKLWAYKDK